MDKVLEVGTPVVYPYRYGHLGLSPTRVNDLAPGHTCVLSPAGMSGTARVPPPTAFLYLPDREALPKAVVRDVDRYYRAMALNAHASSSPARRRIRDHVHKIVQSMDSDHDHALIWLEWVTLFRNEFGLWDMYVDLQNFVLGQLVHTIKICQDEGTVPRKVAASTSARQILAGAHVMMQMKLMHQGQDVLDSYSDSSIEKALD